MSDDAIIADEAGGAEIVSSRVIHGGPVMSLRDDEAILEDGTEISREYVQHPGAVAIAAIDKRGRILLQRQYRHPVKARLWEPPAGLKDVAGESSLTGAKRELYEEADLRASDWRHLVSWYTSPGGSDELIEVFLARGLESVPPGERFERFDEEASLVAAWLPLEDAVDAVMQGRLKSPSAVVAIFAAFRASTTGFENLQEAR